MQEIVNILYNENLNGVRDVINNSNEKDLINLSNAINGDMTLNSQLIYMFLYLITDKYGTCDNIFKLLGKETKYHINSIDILLEFNTIDNVNLNNIIIAKDQIDDYENIYGWNLEDKYLFPCNSSIYSLMTIHRLMKSVSHINRFPDEKDRYKYIIENQIHIIGDAIQNFYLACILDINNEFKKNIFTGDVFSQKYVTYRNNTIYTAAIGEPIPYEGKKKRSYNYVYHKYIKKYISISRITCMLTPSRWFQTDSGDFNYLKKFREEIKNSNKVRLLNYYDMNPDPEHTGGLSYLIIDVNYHGACLYKQDNLYVDLRISDIILKNAGYYQVLHKIRSDKNIDSNFLSNAWSGIVTNDKRLIDDEETGTIKVYVSPKKGGVKWISLKYLKDRVLPGLFDWKVFVPETISTGTGFNDTFILGAPCEICNQTYCGFTTSTKKQALSLISFLKTDFASKILLFRKIKNHINKHSLKYLPYVPLDREWNDEKVVEYFKLNSQEKQIIYGKN